MQWIDDVRFRGKKNPPTYPPYPLFPDFVTELTEQDFPPPEPQSMRSLPFPPPPPPGHLNMHWAMDCGKRTNEAEEEGKGKKTGRDRRKAKEEKNMRGGGGLSIFPRRKV